ncbi:unnamed protein product [Brachionus calyciflorus]|uniref:Uncharacterized protein n=1 Tax=Brachionus calyciflorus TaxID=104777 RepID=A0A814CCQ7_9BILA|nr:unnamed protein product [Brachionus calyciflorus]
MDTFFIKRTLKFESIDLLPDELNCKISAVYFGQILNLKIDDNFLNYHVFKYLKDFRVTGKINFIQKEIFTNIRKMIFDAQNFRQLIHKIGIDWIQSINSNINLNFSSLNDIENYKDLIVRLNISFNYKDYIDYLSYDPILNPYNTFPDEDICLYKNFPFNQFITFVFNSYSYDRVDMLSLSCTTFWLLHKIYNYEIFLNSQRTPNVTYEDLLESSNFNKMLKKCDFKIRFNLCKYESINLKKNIRKSISDVLSPLADVDKIIVFILTPSACLLGMLLNLIIIFITLKANTNNSLILKKQFYYMKWNALLNFLICFIFYFDLLYAIYFTNYFLSFIRSYAFQVFYIFFFQFLQSSLKFSSSCTYLYFSILRCSLIGKDHGKLFVLMMNANPKRLIYSTLFLGGLLNIVKLFSYDINKFEVFLEYPSHKSVTYLFELKFTKLILIEFFNFLTDFTNYVGFLLVSIVFDAILINKLRRTLKIKNKFMRSNLSNSNSYDDLQNKSLALLILNSSFNLLLRLPEIFSLFDNNFQAIFYSFKNGYLQSKNLFILFNFSLQSKIIYVLYKSTSFLYLLSLSSNFLMFYTFNSAFRTSLKNSLKIFSKKSINQKEKSSTNPSLIKL